MVTTPQNKSIKVKKWATIALIAFAGFVVSPIIFLAIKGVIGLAIAAATGMAIVNFAPYVGMKLANWKLKAIKNEADKNPIETLENIIIQKQQDFQIFKNALASMKGNLKTCKVTLDTFSQQYPARANEFTAMYAEFQANVAKQEAALLLAQKNIGDAKDKLDEMKAYWETAKVMQEMNKASSQLNTSDMYERLKQDTAYDSVMTSLNYSFSQLEVDNMTLNIDVTNEKVKLN